MMQTVYVVSLWFLLLKIWKNNSLNKALQIINCNFYFYYITIYLNLLPNSSEFMFFDTGSVQKKNDPTLTSGLFLKKIKNF